LTLTTKNPLPLMAMSVDSEVVSKAPWLKSLKMAATRTPRPIWAMPADVG